MSLTQDQPTTRPSLCLRVVDVMVTNVRLLDRDATVSDLITFFEDDHLHMALVVDDDHVLTAVVRSDLAALGDPRRRAIHAGTLTGRWVGPHEDLSQVQEHMIRTNRRRLVVLGDTGQLLGLLCLKRNGQGFCRDEDVLAREVAPS